MRTRAAPPPTARAAQYVDQQVRSPSERHVLDAASAVHVAPASLVDSKRTSVAALAATRQVAAEHERAVTVAFCVQGIATGVVHVAPASLVKASRAGPNTLVESTSAHALSLEHDSARTSWAAAGAVSGFNVCDVASNRHRNVPAGCAPPTRQVVAAHEIASIRADGAVGAARECQGPRVPRYSATALSPPRRFDAPTARQVPLVVQPTLDNGTSMLAEGTPVTGGAAAGADPQADRRSDAAAMPIGRPFRRILIALTPRGDAASVAGTMLRGSGNADGARPDLAWAW